MVPGPEDPLFATQPHFQDRYRGTMCFLFGHGVVMTSVSHLITVFSYSLRKQFVLIVCYTVFSVRVFCRECWPTEEVGISESGNE